MERLVAAWLRAARPGKRNSNTGTQEAAVAVVVLAGGIAIFLVGLAVGIVVANVFVLRNKERRSRVIGKVRALRATGRGADHRFDAGRF
jgi:MFS superfamily sulfate permease-like transporter